MPFTEMRKVVASRLSESKRTVPHFYLTADLDCTGLKKLRAELAPAVERRYGARLGYNDIIMKCAALALERHPDINASYAEVGGAAGGVLHREINIGLAVAVKNGLVVPVLRGAAQKSLGEISLGLAELVGKARGNRLSPDEYHSGTFTISNLGMYGVDSFQAIINPPESVILALGVMGDRAVVVDGAVVVRPVMTLTLSCDHRVVDGARGAAFLATFCRLLEHPTEALC